MAPFGIALHHATHKILALPEAQKRSPDRCGEARHKRPRHLGMEGVTL